VTVTVSPPFSHPFAPVATVALLLGTSPAVALVIVGFSVSPR
jgi:hypothetical protein